MKTKELIEQLKKADPSGESHVRINGDGIPIYCVKKEGYWDGPYDYFDEDGNWIRTTEGHKVDLYCRDVNAFVSEQIHAHSLTGVTPWEDVKKKFKTETTYCIDDHNDEVYDRLIKEAKEDYDLISDIVLRSYNESRTEMGKNALKGWRWFQNKDVDNVKEGEPNMHVYYTWKVLDENGKDRGSNIHHTECVQKSGFWSKLDNNEMPGYYEWKFILEPGTTLADDNDPMIKEMGKLLECEPIQKIPKE